MQRFQRASRAFRRCARLGVLHERDPAMAVRLARALGVVLGGELSSTASTSASRRCWTWISVRASVIGDRAFHGDPAVVGTLARALIEGLAAVGHGARRQAFSRAWLRRRRFASSTCRSTNVPYAEIERLDLVPYRELIPAGLAGVMPAHVIYPKVDAQPAGFSRVWLQRNPARQAGIRRPDLQRRPVDGGRPRWRATSSGAPRPRSTPAATWCWCAMRPRWREDLLSRLEPVPLDPRRAEGMRPRASLAAYDDARKLVADAAARGAFA